LRHANSVAELIVTPATIAAPEKPLTNASGTLLRVLHTVIAIASSKTSLLCSPTALTTEVELHIFSRKCSAARSHAPPSTAFSVENGAAL
jgi:hypothetical protein